MTDVTRDNFDGFKICDSATNTVLFDVFDGLGEKPLQLFVTHHTPVYGTVYEWCAFTVDLDGYGFGTHCDILALDAAGPKVLIIALVQRVRIYDELVRFNFHCEGIHADFHLLTDPVDCFIDWINGIGDVEENLGSSSILEDLKLRVRAGSDPRVCYSVLQIKFLFEEFEFNLGEDFACNLGSDRTGHAKDVKKNYKFQIKEDASIRFWEHHDA